MSSAESPSNDNIKNNSEAIPYLHFPEAAHMPRGKFDPEEHKLPTIKIPADELFDDNGDNSNKLGYSKSQLCDIYKLDVDFTPTASPEMQTDFLQQNGITVHSNTPGEQLPPISFTFEELDLFPEIEDIIRKNGWQKPTPIQSISIPVELKGRDFVGIAKTGSGKTAAFLIPALLHITQQVPLSHSDGPIALCLSPTRELAQQTNTVAEDFVKALNLRSACIFGGAARHTQVQDLNSNPHFVVATPGRLIDFIECGTVSMNRVSFLILDEADQMLDMGFEPQIRKIIGRMTKKRQTVMFSATWPKEIQQLAADFLVDPVHMHVGSDELTTNPNIQQLVYQMKDYEKTARCLDILYQNRDKKILVFTKTKRLADELSRAIEKNGIETYAIHGDKTQPQRDYVLSQFRNQKHCILVATDVAARGLDVNDVDVVLNYDFPGDIETYVHRIGRTARGNKRGLALTFFTPESNNLSRKLVKILKQANQEIPQWLQDIAAETPKGASKQMRSRYPGRSLSYTPPHSTSSTSLSSRPYVGSESRDRDYGRDFGRDYDRDRDRDRYSSRDYDRDRERDRYSSRDRDYGRDRDRDYGRDRERDREYSRLAAYSQSAAAAAMSAYQAQAQAYNAYQQFTAQAAYQAYTNAALAAQYQQSLAYRAYPQPAPGYGSYDNRSGSYSGSSAFDARYY